VNGRGSKRLGGGRSGGLDVCVAGSHTARRVFVSVLLCVIIVYIIVIWYILWTFVFNLCVVNSFASLFIISYFSLLIFVIAIADIWTLHKVDIVGKYNTYIELYCCNLHVIFLIYLYIVNKPTI